MIAKLVLFLFKVATLQQVCWPYSVGRIVGTSLFAAAAVELVVPWLADEIGNPRQRIEVPSKGMAGPSVDPAFLEDDGGSRTRGDSAYISPAGADSHPRISPRTGSHGQAVPWRRGAWGWDWRVSLLLLASHYLILGVTSRYGALCAVPVDETWSRW